MKSKIARDPYYSTLFKLGGMDLVTEAGWFQDELRSAPDHDGGLCTSLSKIRANLQANPIKPAILVTTGGMAPVHAGHLEMMEKAREAVQAAGYDVVGGFIAPDHDAYIRFKLKAECPESLSSSARVQMVERATRESSWLTVDPWAALHLPCSVNFTDIVEYLRKYVREALDLDIPVFYVCGGDNARLALTFATQGHCCVVCRPGSETVYEKYKTHDLLRDNGNIVWAMHNNALSSTQIRATGLSAYSLPNNIFMRVEDPSVAPLLSSDAWVKVASKMEGLLIDMFDGQVHATQIRSQLARARKITEGENTIGMDAMLPMPFNLAMSRKFAAGGYACLGYTNRPGTLPLDEQVASIPAGEYVLFDDDVATGGTMRFAMSLFEGTEIRITRQACLTDMSDGEGDKEIVDLRDFVIGTEDGGLVIDLPNGGEARAPYIFPFVDPTARASVPAHRAMEFSQAVWKLNANLFRKSKLTIANLPAPSRALFLAAGFSEEEKLSDLCKWYEARCRVLLPEDSRFTHSDAA